MNTSGLGMRPFVGPIEQVKDVKGSNDLRTSNSLGQTAGDQGDPFHSADESPPKYPRIQLAHITGRGVVVNSQWQHTNWKLFVGYLIPLVHKTGHDSCCQIPPLTAAVALSPTSITGARDLRRARSSRILHAKSRVNMYPSKRKISCCPWRFSATCVLRRDSFGEKSGGSGYIRVL